MLGLCASLRDQELVAVAEQWDRYFAPTTASTTIPEHHSRYPQRSSRLNPLSAPMHI